LLESAELSAQPETILNAIQMSVLAPAWLQDQRVLVWEGADGVIQCTSRNPTNLYFWLMLKMGGQLPYRQTKVKKPTNIFS